eukprot:TRINITY_DN13721_c0_g1_i1.p1 TRINITY_DN13721_c0_g1~~TRINITY_DN13721_c0_g1_i1.p1  ORF type:complete len:726 (-),score=97.26 TRINITY_DN13721_c0_g1_i1:179-2356(-)
MLAKAPLYFPEYLIRDRDSHRGTPQTPRVFQLGCLRTLSNGPGFIWSKKKCSKTRFIVVSAGYTRQPMGTPGAYRLTDDDTGESFIIWGGIDDQDSPLPPKEVLSWKPVKSISKGQKLRHGTGSGGVEPVASVSNSGKPMTNMGRSAGSFGRLKSQRVRALIKKSSQIKHQNVTTGEELVSEDAPLDGFDSSDSEVEFVARKIHVGSVKHRRIISRGTQSREVKDTMQASEMILDTKSSNDIRHPEIKHLSKDQLTLPRPSEHKSGVTNPNAHAPRDDTSHRGWSSAGSIKNTLVDTLDSFKPRRKKSVDGGFFSRKSFKQLRCSDDMIESLRGQDFLRPSHIQAMSYVPVLEGKSCIIADQSGSGKTLAYLAPIIQRLRQEELEGVGKSSSGSPRVVILVPTTELASQVLNNCRSISKFGVPFRSMVATGGFRQKTQLDSLQQNLDVLIATPGRFVFLLQECFLQLTNLKCAVLDEVDILFGDEGFEKVLQRLINYAPVATQYLFATATLPVDIYNKVVGVFPDCEVIMGPGMHRTSSGLEEVLVDCSGDGEEKTPDTAFQNKKSALLQLVEETPVHKTIVFCNKIETCRKVENVLKRFDRKGLHVQVLSFHAALAQEARLSNMKEFLCSQSKDSLFLVCTDRASRGIDFANVDHVVLFDFPRDPSEYVRRVGRTARGAGGKGKAFVFVVGKQVSLARRIMERNEKGHPLHDVPSAYELVTSFM